MAGAKNGILDYQLKVNKKYIDELLTKDFLIDQHFNKNKPYKQISNEYKISTGIISKKVREFGLKVRPMKITLNLENKYGKLTLIKKLDKVISGNLIWECRCDCGNIIEVSQGNLYNNHTQSCGCITKSGIEKWWLEKHGNDIGSKMVKNHKKKLSHPGKKNPMYGKPPSHKAGSGYKGRYKGLFFRSLLELSFIIEYLEKNNLSWQSCEKIKFKIPYKDENGVDRTYTPDFIINDEIIIELKPKFRMNSPKNKMKESIAIRYCKENNLTYKMLDFPLISIEKIKELDQSGLVIFTDKTKEKIQKFYRSK